MCCIFGQRPRYKVQAKSIYQLQPNTIQHINSFHFLCSNILHEKITRKTSRTITSIPAQPNEMILPIQKRKVPVVPCNGYQYFFSESPTQIQYEQATINYPHSLKLVPLSFQFLVFVLFPPKQ